MQELPVAKIVLQNLKKKVILKTYQNFQILVFLRKVLISKTRHEIFRTK